MLVTVGIVSPRMRRGKNTVNVPGGDTRVLKVVFNLAQGEYREFDSAEALIADLHAHV